jgi:hypothetical protein
VVEASGRWMVMLGVCRPKIRLQMALFEAGGQ